MWWLCLPCKDVNWSRTYLVPVSLLSGLSGKEAPSQCRRCSLIPGWGRSPGEGAGKPLRYSCLGNLRDRGAWWATVNGVTMSQKWLSNWRTAVCWVRLVGETRDTLFPQGDYNTLIKPRPTHKCKVGNVRWYVIISLLCNNKPVGFPGGRDSKVSACNVGNLGSIPGSGRSPGEGNGNPVQYLCLENSTDRGAL